MPAFVRINDFGAALFHFKNIAWTIFDANPAQTAFLPIKHGWHNKPPFELS
jgi:hypothetical protein